MAEVTEFYNVTRKQAVDVIAAMFSFPRDRALRMTQIADEFTISTAPVPGGLVRVIPNGSNYDVQYHGPKG